MKTGFVSRRVRPMVVVLPCVLAAGVFSLGGCPGDGGNGGNNGGNGSSLTGTWTGEVAYEVATTLGGEPFHTTNQPQATTVTFDDAGKPDKTFIPLLESPLVIAEVPLADLTQEGDTAEVPVDEQGTEQTATVTVNNVSSADKEYSLTLAVNYQSGTGGPPFVGTHRLTATLRDDGTVLWTSDTEVVSGSGSLAVGTTGTSSGTLTKQ